MSTSESTGYFAMKTNQSTIMCQIMYSISGSSSRVCFFNKKSLPDEQAGCESEWLIFMLKAENLSLPFRQSFRRY